MNDAGLKLGSVIAEPGKYGIVYQYRALGPRPGTTTREHRVPGGRFATVEEALAHAKAFLNKAEPWEGHLPNPTKRRKLLSEPRTWVIDQRTLNQVLDLHELVTELLAAEEQVGPMAL